MATTASFGPASILSVNVETTLRIFIDNPNRPFRIAQIAVYSSSNTQEVEVWAVNQYGGENYITTPGVFPIDAGWTLLPMDPAFTAIGTSTNLQVRVSSTDVSRVVFTCFPYNAQNWAVTTS